MYKAHRTALAEYAITDNSDQPIATFAFPKIVWGAEGAPLTAVLSSQLLSNPTFDIGGKKYTAYKKLLTNNLLANDYNIRLTGDNGDVITAFYPGNKWTIPIEHAGVSYRLVRRTLFTFDFTLHRGETQIASFKETTPFFTFTSRKKYGMETTETLDPELLTFSFFLAVCVTY